MHLLESSRLYVRYFTMDDLDNFFRLNGDAEIMRFIRIPKSYEACVEFLEEIIGRYDTEKLNLRLALLEKDTDAFVGSFAIIPIEKTTDTQLGYSLLKKYWGKGYATEIVETGLAYAFNVLGLSSIAAVTELANTASQKVLLKNGFVFEKAYEDAGKEMFLYRKEAFSH